MPAARPWTSSRWLHRSSARTSASETGTGASPRPDTRTCPRRIAAASPGTVSSQPESPGRVLGYLVVAYDLDSIQRLATRFAGSDGISLSLTDQRGALVASPGPMPTALVSRRNDPLVGA